MMFIWRDICHFSSRLATLENSSTPPHLSLFPIPSLYWSNEKDSVAVAVYHDIWTSQINLFLSANLFHHPLCYSDNFLFLSDETKQTSLTTCQRFKQSSHHLTGLSSGMINQRVAQTVCCVCCIPEAEMQTQLYEFKVVKT